MFVHDKLEHRQDSDSGYGVIDLERSVELFPATLQDVLSFATYCRCWANDQWF